MLGGNKTTQFRCRFGLQYNARNDHRPLRRDWVWLFHVAIVYCGKFDSSKNFETCDVYICVPHVSVFSDFTIIVASCLNDATCEDGRLRQFFSFFVYGRCVSHI